MKPISLKFRAFGPYVDEQFIDFNELSKVGLFLICGETGAGKTVILDAMTYALYGKSSGGGRGEISTMRCQLATNDLSTEVEFVFAIHNRRYKFTRSIKYGRKNFTSTQNALVLNDDGVYEPIFENPKFRDVEGMAEELLGLDYEQFRQVVILPQGQFERLLVAKSSEKEEILVSLFGADKWQRIADSINDKINEQRRRLDIEKVKINNSLADKGCQNLDELNALLKSKTEELISKDDEIKNITKNLEAAKKEYELQNTIFEKFNSFDRLKIKLDLLKQKNNEILTLKEKLEKSIKADTIKHVYDNLETASSELGQRKVQVEDEKEKLVMCEESLTTVKKNLDALTSLQTENDAEKIRLAKLIDMTDVYYKIDEAKKSLEIAEKDYNLTVTVVNAQAQSVQNFTNEKLEMSKNEVLLYAQYTEMFNAFISNMSGTLAQELKDNMPCPVCGSIEHPIPAKMLSTDITNDMLDNKKFEIEEIRSSIQTKTTQLEKAVENLNEQKELLNNAGLNKEKLISEYNNLLKNVDSEIKDISELSKCIEELKNKISKFEADLQKAKDDMTKIQAMQNTSVATLALLGNEYEKANKSYEIIKTEFDRKLIELLFVSIEDFKKNLIGDEEKKNLDHQITDYKIDCESVAKNISELQIELENKEKPNIDDLKEILRVLDENNLNLTGEIAVITKDIKGLKELSVLLAMQIEKFEDADARCRENQIFARQLNGVNGVSLQRYVLGVMLTSITTEANRLLENVHDGRYRLFRTLETTGGTRKAGLELEVFDSLSSERRSVVSLSGGEKFLVALSLSIGLSAVVQAQSGGIKLDAMFIDEGFGSLDTSSIGDALMILSNINKTNGLVGIISHVATLKENIDAKIEVSKNQNGSKLTIKI